jgi:hypothetical protein
MRLVPTQRPLAMFRLRVLTLKLCTLPHEILNKPAFGNDAVVLRADCNMARLLFSAFLSSAKSYCSLYWSGVHNIRCHSYQDNMLTNVFISLLLAFAISVIAVPS